MFIVYAHAIFYYLLLCLLFCADTPATPFHASQYKPYEIEIEALALAQLQRKVKEAALNRTRQADARAAKSGFRSGSGSGNGNGYKGAGGDVNLSYDANTGKHLYFSILNTLLLKCFRYPRQ